MYDIFDKEGGVNPLPLLAFPVDVGVIPALLALLTAHVRVVKTCTTRQLDVPIFDRQAVIPPELEPALLVQALHCEPALLPELRDLRVLHAVDVDEFLAPFFG
ncbi:hypothetical protein D3C72_1445400 [compost metagenome]